jgi:predicted small lipoprotein YifL
MRFLLLSTFAASVFLSGCGTKGPLYLPKPVPAEQRPGTLVIPPAAPERPTPAESAPVPK